MSPVFCVLWCTVSSHSKYVSCLLCLMVYCELILICTLLFKWYLLHEIVVGYYCIFYSHPLSLSLLPPPLCGSVIACPREKSQ
jgi:hypothetical protein